MWQKKNFYERLGISRNATEDEISKAHRKLSLKYHPDRVSDNEELRQNYERVSILLGQAKQELTDVVSRAKYDNKTFYSSSTSTESAGQHQKGNGFNNYEDYRRAHSNSYKDYGFDFDDMFSSGFSGQSSRSEGNKQRTHSQQNTQNTKTHTSSNTSEKNKQQEKQPTSSQKPSGGFWSKIFGKRTKEQPQQNTKKQQETKKEREKGFEQYISEFNRNFWVYPDLEISKFNNLIRTGVPRQKLVEILEPHVISMVIQQFNKDFFIYPDLYESMYNRLLGLGFKKSTVVKSLEPYALSSFIYYFKETASVYPHLVKSMFDRLGGLGINKDTVLTVLKKECNPQDIKQVFNSNYY